MKIRKATPADWLAIRRLVKKYPESLLQNNLPRSGMFFVAVDRKEIVGCCALEIYSKRLAEIRSLAVARQSQGQGLATALVESCLQEAKKKKICEVMAIASARRFFGKHGFGTFNKEKYALLKILD
jgi:amino-acid N-acetyltransferase